MHICVSLKKLDLFQFNLPENFLRDNGCVDFSNLSETEEKVTSLSVYLLSLDTSQHIGLDLLRSNRPPGCGFVTHVCSFPVKLL